MYIQKRRFIVALFLLFIVCISTTTAGTLLIGAKTWFALWDSVAGELWEAELEADDPANSFSQENGRGFLIGPVIGYNFDTNPWAVSAAFLFYGKFKQKSEYYIDAVSLNETIDQELDRMDIDVAVSRSVADYLKVFAGFKYTSYESTIVFGGFPNEVKASIQMPTIGLGVNYPVSDKLLLGLQGGLLYVMSSINLNGSDMETGNLIGFNFEVSGSYVLNADWILQGGYRFQKFNIEFIDYLGTTDIESSDVFHGLTIGALYRLDIN